MPRVRTSDLAARAVALAAIALFARVIGFPFLNWDDQDVFLRNDAIHEDGVLAWAFSTRYIEHYQPLAWLTWAALDRVAGLSAAATHGLNVALHALASALVYVLARRLTAASVAPAAIAALFFALHPLRVEVVAWASAMPYPLALALALMSTLAWLGGRSAAATILFGLSLLARPLAFTLPLVLWMLRRPARSPERMAIALMAALAGGALLLESSARLSASLTEFGIGPRLTLAAMAPWTYLRRTVWPVDLTPLEPLALTPGADPAAIVLGAAAIALLSAAAWRWRRHHPVLAGAWAAYLVLLVPAMGFVPSGLQATADRYTYVPAVPLSIALAYALARVTAPAVRAAIAAALVVLTAMTWHQTQHWRDSIALWTRAVEIDARNDVALYNLASALDAEGQRDEAIARYEQVLTLAPGHEGARRNRALLLAAALEEEGNRLAAAENLAAAVDRYADAVILDPRRTHSHAALGVALVQLDRLTEALPHLQTASDLGADDPALANAFAFALAETGRPADALRVLREAQRRHPHDPNIARNLELLEKKKGGP